MDEFLIGKIRKLANELRCGAIKDPPGATFPALATLLDTLVREKPKVADNIIWMAMRYALGRRTYAVNEVIDYIKGHWDTIDDRILDGMRMDIRKAIERGDAGDHIDLMEWQSLLDTWAQKHYTGVITRYKGYACKCGGTVSYKSDHHGGMRWRCDTCEWCCRDRILLNGSTGAFDQDGTDAMDRSAE
jgi:hypothetical protein